MAEDPTYNTPSWVDLSTPDVEGACRFYGDLLGWTIETHDSPMGEYRIGTVRDRAVGGMMAAPVEAAEAPAAWAVLFHVADVDEVVAAVEAAGGMVLEPAFDLPDSRIAILADPSGAVFGVVSQAEPPGPWLSSAPGSVCWIELMSRDVSAAIDFYTTVFGWVAAPGPDGEYTTFRRAGTEVAGLLAMPAEVPAEVTAMWGVYFAVEDCVASARRAETLGGTVLRPATPAGPGRFAVVEDPQGATFQLMDQSA